MISVALIIMMLIDRKYAHLGKKKVVDEKRRLGMGTIVYLVSKSNLYRFFVTEAVIGRPFDLICHRKHMLA
jgi:hypothetical protein